MFERSLFSLSSRVRLRRRMLEEAAAGAAAEEGLLTPEAGVEEALIAG